jgi:ketosteroid isomerase-like protein
VPAHDLFAPGLRFVAEHSLGTSPDRSFPGLPHATRGGRRDSRKAAQWVRTLDNMAEDRAGAIDNKDLVLSYLRARQRGDLERYASYMTDDIVRYSPRPSFDHAQQGKPAVLAGVHTDLFEPGTLLMEIERVIAEEALVAVQFILRGLTVTGKRFEAYQFFLFECRDGKVASEWEYLDTLYSSSIFAT